MPLPFLGSIGGLISGAAKHEIVRNGVTKAYEILGPRAKNLIETNSRVDYTEVLRHLEAKGDDDPSFRDAANRIKQAQQQALDAGVENLFILALGSYIPKDEAKKVRMDEAVARFAWLGGKEDQEFDLLVEGLKHDPVAQFFRHWFLANIVVALVFIDGAADTLAQELKPYADELSARAAKKPTWRTLWLDL